MKCPWCVIYQNIEWEVYYSTAFCFYLHGPPSAKNQSNLDCTVWYAGIFCIFFCPCMVKWHNSGIMFNLPLHQSCFVCNEFTGILFSKVSMYNLKSPLFWSFHGLSIWILSRLGEPKSRPCLEAQTGLSIVREHPLLQDWRQFWGTFPRWS